MFFNTNNLSAEILSVIELEWEKVNANAGFRPFYTLSFRLIGEATFFTDLRAPLHVGETKITYVSAKYNFVKQATRGKIIALHFSSNSQLSEEILRFKPKSPELFRSEFIKLYQVWNKKQFGFNYESNILFYKIILELEHEWATRTPSFANTKLSGALDYIHANFSDGEISVAKLSKMFNMSDTYFRKLFVAEFGTTPLRYINQLRMIQICERLQANYNYIEDIAEECGFNNINYFSAFVKKETGMSPLAYRLKLLGEDITRSRS